ncbi:hypothetical protein JW872_01855 [Candidatus Babeliales bacterium]|nr:hypothetical protein [Candidatus Babeliales bacterium]
MKIKLALLFIPFSCYSIDVYLSRITNNTDVPCELTCHRALNALVTTPEGKVPVIEPGKTLDRLLEPLPQDIEPLGDDPNRDPDSLPCLIRGTNDIPPNPPAGWKLPETCITQKVIFSDKTVTRKICCYNTYQKRNCGYNNSVILVRERLTIKPTTGKITKKVLPAVSICINDLKGKIHITINSLPQSLKNGPWFEMKAIELKPDIQTTE